MHWLKAREISADRENDGSTAGCPGTMPFHKDCRSLKWVEETTPLEDHLDDSFR